MWFDSWHALGQVVATGAASYVLLVLLLRTSGKRTLSKLNAFDLVVTIAMGSVLATTLVSTQATFAQGAVAFVVLVLSQYIVARLSLLSPRFSRLVRAEPRLLVFEGVVLEPALASERVARSELMAAIRQAGVGRVGDVSAVVLETDGSMSVIAAGDGPLDVLDGVKR